MRKNFLVKVIGNGSGIFLPVVTAIFLYRFAFGSNKLENDGSCYAVEHPDYKQYSANPVDSDYKNYVGLKIVDVTERAS